MSILEEWRMRDVEQKAGRAARRLHELDSLRSDVGSLEHSSRKIGAQIDGLCHALDTAIDRIAALENAVIELSANTHIPAQET